MKEVKDFFKPGYSWYLVKRNTSNIILQYVHAKELILSIRMLWIKLRSCNSIAIFLYFQSEISMLHIEM